MEEKEEERPDRRGTQAGSERKRPNLCSVSRHSSTLEVNVLDTPARDRIRVDFRFATGLSTAGSFRRSLAGTLARDGNSTAKPFPFERELILRLKSNFFL